MNEADVVAGDNPGKEFLASLEESGFFRQINDLESQISTIADEIRKFGETSQSRGEEVENLAAHILAIESVLTVLAKKAGVDASEVEDAVKERTAAISGNPEGSPAVLHIAKELTGAS